jgi:uncharacterized protein YcbK (DUF882 family)
VSSRLRAVFAGVIGLVATACLSADRITAASNSADRTISLYHIHTQEKLTVTYKKNGQYVPEAMKQIDWILRDWRKNQSTHMDPTTIDLIWEMHNELGSNEPVNIICGYRSSATNEMLRRTVGGQASQSQHITGKAVDLTFPDVPLKRIRYSALVRERGGVGYYPTSGIPFIHVDSARVRAWPRLPRFELALLFPNGHSQHMPADGGPITRDDVRVAQARYHELAQQIAEFHDQRSHPRPAVMVAETSPPPAPPAPEQRSGPRFAMASLGPAPAAQPKPPAAGAAKAMTVSWEPIPENERPKAAPAPATKTAALTPPAVQPKLVSYPKVVERPSHFAPGVTSADKSKLAALVADAARMPVPKLVQAPAPAQRPAKALAAAAALPAEPAKPAAVVAALEPSKGASSITDMSPDSLGNGWVQAPEFDEDHPEELAYRPFPLAPLLTETSSAHDVALVAELQHPDVARTLEMLDDVGAIQPMRFRPGQQVAQVMWAQQFEGKAVHLDALEELDRSRAETGIISNRAVKTSQR